MIDERRIAGEFPEQLAESALIPESAMFHGFLNGSPCCFQHLTGGVQSAAGDECNGGKSGFLPEEVQKAGFAQTGCPGKIFYPELPCESLFDPGDRAENAEISGPCRRFRSESVTFFPQNGGELCKKFQNGLLLFPAPVRESPEVLFQKRAGDGRIPLPENSRQQEFPALAVVEKRNDQFRYTRVTGADERFLFRFRPAGQQKIIVF